ncbi:CPBP family intramembrane glutamic endopeptidase [Haloarcula sp. GH36]|uniref:CPBP family intramembrane glutamic endopeptidase n=1 Tax=Haloarcula montana TaxID=3111776 RepID=UPI002D7A34BF|nr:CPBP family intramembrane glutamic endopeptidase [Haloarcula sp. GH36]
MSVISRQASAVPDRTAVWAVLSTFGLAVTGGVAAFGGILVISLLASTLGIAGTDAYAVVARSGTQVGFAVVAVVFLLVAGDRSRYVKLRWPTLEDLGWIAVLPFVLFAVSAGLTLVLPAIGISTPSASHGAEGTKALLIDRPILWVVVIPGLYVFAAPVEELLYRGIVQGRLRPHLGTGGIVLVSAVAFGLMHTIVFALSPPEHFVYSILSISAAGAVWAVVYERTENLAVTAVNHAMSWTVPFGALIPFV